MNVLVIGAGGHGQVVADILRVQQSAGCDVSFAGYLDDRIHSTRATLGDLVVGRSGDWSNAGHDALIVAIGDNETRRHMFDQVRCGGGRFAIAQHPSAVVADDVQLGQGSMVCAGAILNTGAVIGANTIINTAATIDHHCRIGDHAHIAPGVRLGGDVCVDDGVLVGIGAIVLPGRRIGAWATVGAGAVVIADVEPGATVVGVPARAVAAHSK